VSHPHDVDAADPASLTMGALWVAACPHEAGKFFTFLADAAASQLQD
jgi:hypothetical protein